MFKIVSIHWDNRKRDWLVTTNKCKIKSDKKNILEISVDGFRKNLFIHKNIFDFLTIYYKAEENENNYTNIDWAALSLDECIIFIEKDSDINKCISYFYRTLEKIEENEELKGNKLDHFYNRTQLSHGLFYPSYPHKEKRFGKFR
jgi:hypothetical protein